MVYLYDIIFILVYYRVLGYTSDRTEELIAAGWTLQHMARGRFGPGFEAGAVNPAPQIRV